MIGPYYFRVPDRHTIMAQMSYVTGTHAIKIGMTYGFGGNRHQRSIYGGLDLYQEYNTVNGVRVARVGHRVLDAAGGRRADQVRPRHLRAGHLQLQAAQPQPGHPLRAVQHLRARGGIARPAGSCRTVSSTRSRIFPTGVTWRPASAPSTIVTGDGKTAIKGHIGKYMQAFSTVGFAAVYNPMVIAVDRRTWTDPNRRRHRAGQRDRSRQHAVQHQRRQQPRGRSRHQAAVPMGNEPGHPARNRHRHFGVVGNWVHRDFKRIFWTDNILVSASDYTVVNIPNPLNASAS